MHVNTVRSVVGTGHSPSSIHASCFVLRYVTPVGVKNPQYATGQTCSQKQCTAALCIVLLMER